jgi:nitrate/TMAO reductase-like tetraheme cytochrome c subunit
MVSRARRLVLDTGQFIAGESEQDFLKYDIIVQALVMLDYDVVNLNERDAEIAQNRFGLENMPFPVISSWKNTGEAKQSYTKILKMGGTVLPVTTGSIQSGQITVDEVEKLFPPEGDILGLNILLVDSCGEDMLEAIAQAGDLVDVVVCPAGGDEPHIVSQTAGKPLVISSGQLGKYVGKLSVKLSEAKLELAYEKIAIDKSLGEDDGLVQLYHTYQKILKEDNYLQKVAKVPLPNGLKYVGSDKCRSCHDYEYKKWAKLKHAHAYQTLVGVNAQYNPECIECHVVGLRYESGFYDENSPKRLRNVGCETCHGARSQHISDVLSSDNNIKKNEPVAALSCIECHTYEHSPGYQADTGGYFNKIIHWKEPKQDLSVK